MGTDNNNKFASFAQFAQFESLKNADGSTTHKQIPDEVYANLPEFLKEQCDVFEGNKRKDIFLTSSLGILSGLFNGVKGLYANEEHYPNLNVFISGSAAGYKGTAKFAMKFGKAIHQEKVEAAKKAYQAYKKVASQDNPLPVPPQELLFIPGNTSSAMVVKHLDENEGCGIICETEADTMSDNFNQDWGGYSDIIRNAFHHETISLSRKGNREFVEVEKPKLSIVLTGTPDQVGKLIKSSENGLFSRFIFYTYEGQDSWISVAPKKGRISFNEHFDKVAQEVKKISEYFSGKDFVFELTDEQWNQLDSQFSAWLDIVTTFVSEGTASIVKRLGLVQFRIAMILSILRHYENKSTSKSIICTDIDFKTAQLLSDVYLTHSLKMFFKLPHEENQGIDKRMKAFFDKLPEKKEFQRKDAVSIGQGFKVEQRTVDKYLKRLVEIKLLNQPEYGKYKKIE